MKAFQAGLRLATARAIDLFPRATFPMKTITATTAPTDGTECTPGACACMFEALCHTGTRTQRYSLDDIHSAVRQLQKPLQVGGAPLNRATSRPRVGSGERRDSQSQCDLVDRVRNLQNASLLWQDQGWIQNLSGRLSSPLPTLPFASLKYLRAGTVCAFQQGMVTVTTAVDSCIIYVIHTSAFFLLKHGCTCIGGQQRCSLFPFRGGTLAFTPKEVLDVSRRD